MYFRSNSWGYLWSRALLRKRILQFTGTTTVRATAAAKLDKVCFFGIWYWTQRQRSWNVCVLCVCVIHHPHMLSINDCCSAHDLFWMHKLKPWCKRPLKLKSIYEPNTCNLFERSRAQRIFRGCFISFSFPNQGPWLVSFHLLPYYFQYHFNRLWFIDYGLAQSTQQTIQFLSFWHPISSSFSNSDFFIG